MRTKQQANTADVDDDVWHELDETTTAKGGFLTSFFRSGGKRDEVPGSHAHYVDDREDQQPVRPKSGMVDQRPVLGKSASAVRRGSVLAKMGSTVKGVVAKEVTRQKKKMMDAQQKKIDQPGLPDWKFQLLPPPVRAQLQRLYNSEELERAKLPNYIRKLIGGYELEAYHFEIVECLRKLLLVCMPILFVPAGSAAQLIFGLLVCFLSFGAYVARARGKEAA